LNKAEKNDESKHVSQIESSTPVKLPTKEVITTSITTPKPITIDITGESLIIEKHIQITPTKEKRLTRRRNISMVKNKYTLIVLGSKRKN